MIETHGTSMTSAHYSRMGYEECDKIHKASLEILERLGIDVHDEKAIAILVAGGAQADGIRVRLPEYMVARALATSSAFNSVSANPVAALRSALSVRLVNSRISSIFF